MGLRGVEFLRELIVEVAASASMQVRVCCSLREQVRNLRVQEFLRELIVGVAAPSDLTRSILVESFKVMKAGM